MSETDRQPRLTIADTQPLSYEQNMDMEYAMLDMPLKDLPDFEDKLTPVEPSEERVVSVDFDDCQEGTEGDLLLTDGIGSCIGMVIDNRTELRTLLGHFVDPHSDELQIRAYIEQFLTYSTTDRLTIYLRGCAPTRRTLKALATAQKTRSKMLEILNSFGITPEQINTVWNDSTDHGTYMKFSVSTGELESEIYSLEPDDSYGTYSYSSNNKRIPRPEGISFKSVA